MKRYFNTIAILVFFFAAGTWSAEKHQGWKYIEKDPEKKICFAMYTVEKQVLKLTAQLYPLQEQDSRDIYLEIEKDAKWERVAQSKVRENDYAMSNAKAWNTLFRVQNWDHS